MTKIRYYELTQEQKDWVCNGCGGKGGWVKVPQFMFEADCNHHDFNYYLGFTEADRKKADVQFYEALKIDAINTNGHFKPIYFRIWAKVYYYAVRFCGKKFFSYGDREKTLEDLVEDMKKNP